MSLYRTALKKSPSINLIFRKPCRTMIWGKVLTSGSVNGQYDYPTGIVKSTKGMHAQRLGKAPSRRAHTCPTRCRYPLQSVNGLLSVLELSGVLFGGVYDAKFRAFDARLAASRRTVLLFSFRCRGPHLSGCLDTNADADIWQYDLRDRDGFVGVHGRSRHRQLSLRADC